MNQNYLKKKSKELRKKLFEKFYLLQEGHPGSVFSILDFLTVLYYCNFVKILKKNKKKIPVDDVIMSKGHATVGQYPILYDLEVIKKNDWLNWGKNQNTCLRMFGNSSIPGIKVATGSLGHGIGYATGIAYASKRDKINKNIYVIISEGELYEGSTWEALLLLAKLKLDNVYIILDINNNIILGDPRKCLTLGNIKKKIESFDIVVKTSNGQNFNEMNTNLKLLKKIKKPKCLILNTIKGKGLKIMENKAQWHYWNKIKAHEYEECIRKLTG